jgi:hypothetical protein
LSEPGPGVLVVEVVRVGWRPSDGWISNPYVLEVSLIGELLVAVSTPYLKILIQGYKETVGLSMTWTG